MRVFAFLTTIALAFAAGAVTTAAQKPGKKDKSDSTESKKEPAEVTEIGGKTLDEWIKAIGSTDRSESSTAIKTILGFGPEKARKAIPALIAELKKHKTRKIDASVRVNIPTTLTTIFTSIKKPSEEQLKETIDLYTWMLGDDQIVVRYRVIQALTPFGPAAREAIPKLIKLTKDFPTWETRYAATVALASIAQPIPSKDKEAAPKGPGTDVIDALYARLKDTSSQVRIAAINALRALGVHEMPSQRSRFQTEVGPVTQDIKPLVKIMAQVALYNMNPKLNKGRRTAIAKYVFSRETAVRLEAIGALAMLRKDSKDQLPVLYKAAADPDQTVGAAAMHAIGAIGAEVVDARDWLSELIVNTKQELPIRIEAIRALGGLGPKAKDRRKMFSKLLEDSKEDLAIRVDSARALGSMGEEAADQLPVLVKCATDKEVAVALNSIFAIAAVGIPARSTVPMLKTLAANKKTPEPVQKAAEDAAKYLFELKTKTKKGPTKKGAE
jgi:HEAT repeat protein